MIEYLIYVLKCVGLIALILLLVYIINAIISSFRIQKQKEKAIKETLETNKKVQEEAYKKVIDEILNNVKNNK